MTTYFSDYILVPYRARQTVTKALEQRGFAFSHSASAFVSQLSPSSPVQPPHRRQQSSSSSFEGPAPPSTPPARNVDELQRRTFGRLEAAKITPAVDGSIRLISCAGSRDADATLDARLQHDLLQVLLSTCPGALPSSHTTGLGVADADNSLPPDFSTRFLSLTLTDMEPISVLLEQPLVPILGSSLLGSKSDEDVLVPIVLDLRELPFEATGIVCGVAGRLAQGTAGQAAEDSVEISFLSTARSGTVIVKENKLQRAVKALEEAEEFSRAASRE